jgi:asparaginyl-tRNA synthetase
MRALNVEKAARVRSAVIDGLREYYNTAGVTEVRVPQLVDPTGSCESVATLLAVISVDTASELVKDGPSSKGKAQLCAFLGQTGQLALENALTEVNACWCQTTSFRNEQEDLRHLREFELIEEEFSAMSSSSQEASAAEFLELFDELLDRITAVTRAAVDSVLKRGVAADIGLPVKHLEAMLNQDFIRLTYEEALDVCNNARSRRGPIDSGPREKLEWGDDLTSVDEHDILQSLARKGESQPAFVTLYPTELKFFNMKPDPRNEQRVLSADLLFPFAGESVGAAVRENDPVKLEERLIQSSMFREFEKRHLASIDTFEPYLNLIRSEATPLHAGYGIGLERLMQFMICNDDIRNVSISSKLGRVKLCRIGKLLYGFTPSLNLEDLPSCN